MRRSFFVFGLSLVPFVTLASCGGDDPPAQTSSSSGGASSSSSASSSGDGSSSSSSSSSTSGGSSSSSGEPPWVWDPPVVPKTSPGCGIARGPIKGVKHTTADGRQFHVWGPTGYDANTNYPVVVMYHGWYTNGPGFQSWFEQEKFVENGAIVVYPTAAGANGEWDLDGDTDLVFFDDMMKMLGEDYCIDPSRVLGFGFSYGGKLMNRLGCKRAGWVKAVSIADSSDWGDYKKCGRLPVLVTHRTEDSDELIAWGRNARDRWATANECTNATVDGDVAHNCKVNTGCKAPGSVTFCEDTSIIDPGIPGYSPDWKHTVMENYRLYTWKWFKAL